MKINKMETIERKEKSMREVWMGRGEAWRSVAGFTTPAAISMKGLGTKVN